MLFIERERATSYKDHSIDLFFYRGSKTDISIDYLNFEVSKCQLVFYSNILNIISTKSTSKKNSHFVNSYIINNELT